MTAIAFERATGILAADSMITEGYQISGSYVKIFILHKRYALALAGSLAGMVNLASNLEHQTKSKVPKAGIVVEMKKPPNASGVEGMLIDSHNGNVFFIEEGLFYHAPDGAHYAMGCGGDFCRAAMMAGANAVKAVEIACQLSTHCGPPVLAYKITKNKIKKIKT